jgi:hypothetical protein
MRFDWFFADVAPVERDGGASGRYKTVSLAGGCILIRPPEFQKPPRSERQLQADSDHSFEA